MSVEVERKFLFGVDTLKKLEEIGAVCIGQRQFRDQYFDTPEFDLTLKDMWLRKREGCWELKYPTEGLDVDKERSLEQCKSAALCTRYNEITNLPDIQLRVKGVIKNMDTGTSPLPEDEWWPSKLNLMCFADFTTVRQSYRLEEGVQIDLDQADFDYKVGEVEVVIPEGGDMQCALEKIDQAAQKLGLNGDQKVAGKMNVYLQKHNPEHHAKLLSVHIL